MTGVQRKKVLILKLFLKMEKQENTNTTNIQFEVSITKKNAKGEVIDALASGAKLTKADAGKAGFNSEEWLTVTVEAGMEKDQPKVTVNSHNKLTKADAGKASTGSASSTN